LTCQENGVTPEHPRVSVIIPARNAERTIDRCLEALRQQTAPRETYEIIVVDDGSSDGTVAQAGACPDVLLLQQAPAGPAVARNLGVRHAAGEIVLFTDADCAPVEDWIECMEAPFQEQGIAGVKGAYLTDQRSLIARFVQEEYEDKYALMARDTYIDFVDTYAAGYRRDVFVANGGFDPAFSTASVEDQEFSFRLARQGHKMVFVPSAQVRHLGHAASLGAYFHKKFKIGYWKVLVHRRHPGKLFRDSHTPQVLKVQILLLAFGGLCLVGSGIWLPLLWISCGLGFLFLLTTLPFTFRAWRRDRWVAVVSPGLLLVRALALGMGFALGLTVHLWPRDSTSRQPP
jgi:glycosyltransferase involved in cell wall biosynthesis